MLESMTAQTFHPLVGTEFFVTDQAGNAICLVLGSVAELPYREGLKRAPFSLVFHGPVSPAMPQRTYAVRHAALGGFDLFLVPVGPAEGSMRYEAVFS